MTSRHVYWYLRAYAFHCQVYDSNLIPKLSENHARVLPKSIKNLSKIALKWGPGGFLGRWGALPRGQEASGLIFNWFGGPFRKAFWSRNAWKLIRSRFGMRQSAQKNGTRFWMASNIVIDCWPIFCTHFWKVFLDTFWGSSTRARS